jgi:hypothetical protein
VRIDDLPVIDVAVLIVRGEHPGDLHSVGARGSRPRVILRIAVPI